MFWLLNKSAIWHLCQCVNHWLWNLSKWPFTGAVLQSASRSNHPHARPRWSAQGTRAVGRGAVGRSVSRWYQISHASQVHRFTWATRIPSSGQRWMRHLCKHTSMTHLTTFTKYICSLSGGSNVLPDFWHRLWACGLSSSATDSRNFTVTAISCYIWNGRRSIVNETKM